MPNPLYCQIKVMYEGTSCHFSNIGASCHVTKIGGELTSLVHWGRVVFISTLGTSCLGASWRGRVVRGWVVSGRIDVVPTFFIEIELWEAMISIKNLYATSLLLAHLLANLRTHPIGSLLMMARVFRVIAGETLCPPFGFLDKVYYWGVA